jgi:transmembrane sensor
MNTQINEEAVEWLIRCRERKLDPAERGRFDDWLRESPAHVRAFLEMSAVWENLAELDSSSIAPAHELLARLRAEDGVLPFDYYSSQQRSAEPPASRTSTSFTAPRSVRNRTLLALAAVLLVAVGGGWLYAQRDIYSTGISEQRSITLPDGSTIELNSRSRVRVRYSAAERDVDLLEGQALFNVAKVPDRPFVVLSGNTEIRAVGTEFDIDRKATGVRVTVVEGRVAVLQDLPKVAGAPAGEVGELPAPAVNDEVAGTATPKASRGNSSVHPVTQAAPTQRPPAEVPLFLDAGQQVVARSNSTLTAPQHADIAVATAWTRHRLIFESAPLTEVAEEFNRYNQRQLVIEDPGLANFRISGVFSSVDATLLLQFLRAQPNLAMDESADEIRIRGR